MRIEDRIPKAPKNGRKIQKIARLKRSEDRILRDFLLKDRKVADFLKILYNTLCLVVLILLEQLAEDQTFILGR
jgi:hypothetical protein